MPLSRLSSRQSPHLSLQDERLLDERLQDERIGQGGKGTRICGPVALQQQGGGARIPSTRRQTRQGMTESRESEGGGARSSHGGGEPDTRRA